MTQTVKSVLFFDYDSLHRSLDAVGGAGAAFAEQAGAWLAAIERGEIVRSAGEGGDQTVRRRLLVKRCYADPRLLGANRAWLTANGVQVVDCPPLAGHVRNAADIHLALDSNDALAHATGFEEFILLSADADLTPLLFRLRAHNRASVIYATGATTAEYRAFADGAIEADSLLGLLAPDGVVKTADPLPEATGAAGLPVPAAPASVVLDGKPVDREELTTLVRRLHQAARVPLFSPRVFADLFRMLAQEVADNGYRFQTTAENVATRLVEAGRNVTRRQVGFVVKGLALKGHVFSAHDSPERLAEMFREQVFYLARNADMRLDDREKSLISAWIVGRLADGGAAELPPPERQGVADAEPDAQPPEAEPEADSARSGSKSARMAARQDALRSEVQTIAKSRTDAGKGAGEMVDAPGAATKVAGDVTQGDAPLHESGPGEGDEAAEPVADEVVPPRKAEAKAGKAARAKETRDEAPAPIGPETAAAAAARAAPPAEAEPAELEAASAQGAEPADVPPEVPADPPKAKSAAARSTGGARRSSAPDAVSAGSGARRVVDPAEKEAMEKSILAAIAEAVDVLVEDRSTDTVRPATAEAAASSEDGGKPGGDDIGDEIQRILASYSQTRGSGR